MSYFDHAFSLPSDHSHHQTKFASKNLNYIFMHLGWCLTSMEVQKGEGPNAKQKGHEVRVCLGVGFPEICVESSLWYF